MSIKKSVQENLAKKHKPKTSLLEKNKAETAVGMQPGALAEQAMNSPSSLSANSILQLQRMVGNNAVSRILRQQGTISPTPQAKTVQREIRSDALGFWYTTKGTKCNTKKQAQKAEAEEIAADEGRITVNTYQNNLQEQGNYTLGDAKEEDANAIGCNWVGKALTGDYTVSSDGKRQYRKPAWKPNQGKYQANVESRAGTSGQWTANGHITIVGKE